MNWKIWSLTLFGLLMGFAAVFGLTQKYEWVYWLIIALIAAAVIAKVADRQIFTKGVVVGLFMGILNGIIVSLLFDKYLENNPSSLGGFTEVPANIPPQYFVLITAPFIGMAYGLFLGLVAFLFDKFTGKKIEK